MKKRRRKLTPIQTVILSFIAVIILGAVILMFPFCSRDGEWTGFVDTLFTATSAACVTGLVTLTTAAHWGAPGQAIILVLIQIGGLGAITIIAGSFAVLKNRTSLSNTRMIMQAAGNDSFSGVVRLVRRIFLGTLIFEFSGAVLLAIRFIPLYGWLRGTWYSVFHSISAFCNAGFDVLGDSSMEPFATDALVMLTLSALIIIGGLGFMVWDDLITEKFKWKKLKFHSKVVITMTLALIIVPWALFFLLEGSAAFAGRGFGDKLLMSFFQAVTPRTAGFAAVPMGSLSDSGAILTMILMLIGGSPGSTAGGIKTTTIAVMAICTASSMRRSDPVAFHRRIDDTTVRQATAIVLIYIAAAAAATMLVCAVDHFPMRDAAFEVFSAIATVGLSTGITSSLGVFSKLLLTALMFLGRIGGLTLAIAISGERAATPVKQPTGKLMVG